MILMMFFKLKILSKKGMKKLLKMMFNLLTMPLKMKENTINKYFMFEIMKKKDFRNCVVELIINIK